MAGERGIARVFYCFLSLVRAVLIIIAAMFLTSAVFSFFGAISNVHIAAGFISFWEAHTIFSLRLSLPEPVTPWGGLLHLDQLVMCLIFLFIEWPVSRLADVVHNASVRRRRAEGYR